MGVRVSIEQLVIAPYDVDPFRKQRRPTPEAVLAVAAVAFLMSIGVHTAFALVLSAAWFDDKHLEDEAQWRRRMLQPPPPPPIVVDLDDTAYDAHVADFTGAEVKKDAAPGAGAVAQAPTTDAAAEPAAKQAPRSVKQEVVQDKVARMTRSSQELTHQYDAESGAPHGVGGEGRASASASASPLPSATASGATSTSPSASGSGSAAGVPGDDGTTFAEKAPDVVARFAKDLPRWGVELPAWAEVAAGSKLEAQLVIELDETGRVVVAPEDPDGPKDALTVTMQRTLRGLFTKLALPDHPIAAGRATVSVQATVADGAPVPDEDIEISFSYTKETRKGRSHFVLKTGRTVVFEIGVVSVEVGPKAAPGSEPQGRPVPRL